MAASPRGGGDGHRPGPRRRRRGSAGHAPRPLRDHLHRRRGPALPVPGPVHHPRQAMSDERELRVTFTREQIAAYAEASGDHNPIHLDEEFAKSVGLPGVIAHGMLQWACWPASPPPTRAACGGSRAASGIVQPGDTVSFRAVESDREVQRRRPTRTASRF